VDGLLRSRAIRRAGYGEDFITEVAHIMEYAAAYEIYRGDIAYDQGTGITRNEGKPFRTRTGFGGEARVGGARERLVRFGMPIPGHFLKSCS